MNDIKKSIKFTRLQLILIGLVLILAMTAVIPLYVTHENKKVLAYWELHKMQSQRVAPAIAEQDDQLHRIEGETIVEIVDHYGNKTQAQAKGYANESGEIVIEPQFLNSAKEFVEGRAWAIAPGRWPLNRGTCGYIDVTGKWVVEPQFYSASQFRNGMAKVFNLKDDSIRQYGFVSHDGRVIVTPRFDVAEDFGSDYALVGNERLHSKLYTSIVPEVLGYMFPFRQKFRYWLIDKEGRIINVDDVKP